MPKIRVWYSNRLERLADLLAGALAPDGRDPAAGLFARPPVVVPNPQIAAYLRYEVARRTGIAAGLRFPGSEEFLASLLPPSRPAVRLLDRNALRALFLEVLGDRSADDPGQPLPEPVNAYLDAAGDDSGARDLRRFQLATRLARLARQYGDARPELLRAWAEGRATLGDGPLAETEGWQLDLWRRLVGAGGPLDRARASGGSDWVLPLELFGRLATLDGYRPPAEVHVFGFSYVWTGLREMLEHLGRTSDVHVYVPLPCAAFRGDAAADVAGGPGLEIARAWGRPGVEFARMLDGLTGVVVTAEFEPPAAATVLGRLQGEVIRGAATGPEPFAPDGCLTVLACPGIRREAEVIAGEIWRLVREDDARQGTSADRLRFRDVAVLIADPRNKEAYQTHLRAALEELHEIPFTMIDLPLAGECRAVEAVLRLLDLPLGEFTRSELLPLLTHPAVRARFPGADADRWRAWCQQLEIVRGADRLDHEGTYIDRDLFHWDQGLRRLVLGAFMTGPRCGDDRAFRLGGSEWLPHDEPAEAQADAARLLLLVRSLAADARFARSARLTFTGWSTFLARLITAYLAADSDAEQRALGRCLAEAHGLKRLDLNGQMVGYRVACECLREAVTSLTDARGHYLASGVAVAPLLEMRALPFRVVFVCGMGEGLFPAPDGPDPLDLLSRGRRHPGDVSPRDRDRYLFLETLAGTRERLYLSYVGRDAQTGDDLEPSPLVHELLRYLRRGGLDDAAGWIRKAPLRRHEGIDATAAPVAAPAARREARAKELRASFRTHAGASATMTSEALWRLGGPLRDWLGLCPPYEPKTGTGPARRLQVSIRELRQFLECPLQGWARLMLRLREDDDGGEAERDDEPFATARLHETILLREVFLDALQRPPGEPSRAALEALYSLRAEVRSRAGVMPVGLFREADRRRHLACLGSWHEGAARRDLLRHGPFRVHRFGRAAENERVDTLGDPIPLDVPLTDANGRPVTVRVELYGRTEMVSRSLPGSLTCVTRKDVKDKDFLGGFLDAVVLSLVAGHHEPAAGYHVHVLTGPGGGKPATPQRQFRNLDAEQARAYLAGLLSDVLGAPHAYLLPCEAVFEFLTKKRPVATIIEEMKDDDRKACSSRYGPVPNFVLYDPPDDDEAEAIIERRFGLYQKCGGVPA
jgi:exodeoxyribonuclease V gamma subunit